jgi:uncharacterized protein (TIGR02145 family)
MRLIQFIFFGLFALAIKAQENTGIGTINPDQSAILDVTSTELGFLLPRMTTAQRDAISSPAEALMIFNTTTKCLEIFVQGWYSLWCDTSTTNFTCGDSVSFVYNGMMVTYGTVLSNGRCWLDRNLGALQVATGSIDYLAYGDLFQWGRPADGHQLINWTAWNMGNPFNSTTMGACDAVATDNPPHSNFIKCNSSPVDWRLPQNPNLWQGVSGVNNPCPPGFRLPTDTELNNERLNWSSNNAAGAYASSLKLTTGGIRLTSDGGFNAVGVSGTYWSYTVSSSNSRRLSFNNSGASMNADFRTSGVSVRCIKD